MRVWTLEVPAPCTWVNSNQRLHRMQEAKLTATWRQAGHLLARAAKLPAVHGRVHVVAHFWKPHAGRYDPNNLWPTVKAAVDGMVDAGVFADDDHLHMLGPDMRHGGKGPARLVLTVTELPDTPQASTSN